MDPAEQVQFLAGKPEPTMFLAAAGTSSSTAPMEQAEQVEPSPVAPMEQAKPVAAAENSSSQASAVSHQADAPAPVIVNKRMINGMENRLWLSYHKADWVRDWELVAPNTVRDVDERFDVPEQPDEELEVQDGDYNIVDQVPSASHQMQPCTVVAQPPSHDIADDSDDGSSVQSHSTFSDPDLMKNGKDAEWNPFFLKS